MSPPEPAADLLGAPLNIELVLHDTAKRIVDSETSGASPRRSLAGSCVGQVAVIDAPVVLVDVAAHLATDRRGRTLEPPGDLPDPEVLARSVAAQSPSEIRASGRTQGGSSLQCVGRCQLRPALYQRPWCSFDLWGRVWWRGSGGCGLLLSSTARGRYGRGGGRRAKAACRIWRGVGDGSQACRGCGLALRADKRVVGRCCYAIGCDAGAGCRLVAGGAGDDDRRHPERRSVHVRPEHVRPWCRIGAGQHP